MKYALLDWDNTIRRGYTLFSLMNYLVNQKILDLHAKIMIDSFLDEYKSGLISHDLLALKCCEVFASHLKGKKTNTVNTAITHYIDIDKQYLFNFSSTIFRTLQQNNISPIIISGAPTSVIKHYSNFKIFKIYGFSLEENNGIFTGEVSSNYGYNKKIIVDRIIAEMKSKPVFAFGDSLSDYEMLSSAQKSIIICRQNSQIPFKTDGIIFNNSSRKYVTDLINEYVFEFQKQSFEQVEGK